MECTVESSGSVGDGVGSGSSIGSHGVTCFALTQRVDADLSAMACAFFLTAILCSMFTLGLSQACPLWGGICAQTVMKVSARSAGLAGGEAGQARSTQDAGRSGRAAHRFRPI